MRNPTYATSTGRSRRSGLSSSAAIRIDRGLRALHGGKLLCLVEGSRAGNLELDGCFGKSPEKIFVRHARAQQARENPD